MECTHEKKVQTESHWWWTCDACGYQRLEGHRVWGGDVELPRFAKGTLVRFLAKTEFGPRTREGKILCFFMKDIGKTQAVYAMVSDEHGEVYEAAVTKFQHASAVDALGSLSED